MVVVSPRRMGKTGLIHHCFHQPEIEEKYYTFFVDIYATNSFRELVYMLGRQIFDVLKPRGISFVEHYFSVIASLRPAFKFDSVTGQPVFDIGIGDIHRPEIAIEEIFSYLEHADRPCFVAIDEFQQIAKYAEKNVEAILRTYIQRCVNTTFVFAGSQEHMMQKIFFSASRPFYHSASFLHLKPIEYDSYLPFVVQHFSHSRKFISTEVVKMVYSFFEGHTWYIQLVFNRLFDSAEQGVEINSDSVKQVIDKIVAENEVMYQNILGFLPERQKEVLIAVAKDRIAINVTSAEFIRRHALASSSSVQSSIKTLLDKDLITRINQSYQVYDRLFALYILNVYGNGYHI